MTDNLMRLVPLHDKVLVRPRKLNEVTKSGIAIPETTTDKERPESGFVVAVNEGVTRTEGGVPVLTPSSFREGDIVFFTRHVGMSVTIEGQKFLMLNEDQIIGKISVEKLSDDERKAFENGGVHDDQDQEESQGTSAQGVGGSGGDADTDEDVGEGEALDESSGEEAGDVRSEREELEA